MKQKKLTLNKMTVSNLNLEAMASLKGGLLLTDPRVCETILDGCDLHTQPAGCGSDLNLCTMYEYCTTAEPCLTAKESYELTICR